MTTTIDIRFFFFHLVYLYSVLTYYIVLQNQTFITMNSSNGWEYPNSVSLNVSVVTVSKHNWFRKTKNDVTNS